MPSGTWACWAMPAAMPLPPPPPGGAWAIVTRSRSRHEQSCAKSAQTAIGWLWLCRCRWLSMYRWLCSKTEPGSQPTLGLVVRETNQLPTVVRFAAVVCALEKLRQVVLVCETPTTVVSTLTLVEEVLRSPQRWHDEVWLTD